MDPKKAIVTKEHYDLPEDYPFKEAFAQQQKAIKRKYRTGEQMMGKRKVTMTIEDEWLPIPFSRLFQNREVLGDLSPEGCKILVHIALRMGFSEHKVQLIRTDIGLSKRVFSRALLELIFKRVLQKVENKREWYWVNLTILIVGNIDKLEPNGMDKQQ
jgi:hypothetical protein